MHLAGIAAPVFKAGGELAGAITLTMPAARYSERYIAHVRAAADRVTRALGGAVPG